MTRMLLALCMTFAGAALVGCADEIAREEEVEVRDDGTVVRETQTVTEDDGTVRQEETRTVDRPD